MTSSDVFFMVAIPMFVVGFWVSYELSKIAKKADRVAYEISCLTAAVQRMESKNENHQR